ncbi:hypothetical protein BDA99DRAFT_442200 [Phascolomyces articulosus]|uniref:NADPH--cytochrome P450 reductase n=1 Tax=Phascolomyces articulosus TaxID=60185 RepID=A0AAD5PBN4_9FUNG|nr:hypothetical protein BDA99DRAFT_442200 [Phascolomyces articulosus]
MSKHIEVNRQVILLISALGLGTVAYLASQYFFGNSTSSSSTDTSTPGKNNTQIKQEDEPSNFVKTMKKQDRKVVIFYGSQTGTAEDCAQRIGKQCKKRFGVAPLVLDIENCDMKYLDQVPEDSLAIFVMATYGEGEPTDNAQEFWDLLENPEFSEGGNDLKNLRYFIFGLGNSSYTYYNWVSKTVDEKLTEFGAARIGELGMGDDENSLEDDFEAWQDGQLWPLFGDALQVDAASQDSSSVPDTTYKVVELDVAEDGQGVYCGELGEKSVTSWGAKKPYPAPITSRDLLTGSDRHCLHLEVDISGTGMTYTTGDHIAIWPTNSEDEVFRLARAFGLDDKLDTVIRVTAADETSAKQSPFPQPTTYRAMFRHYLDICQIPSRDVLQMLVRFAPTPEAGEIIKKLVTDKEEYRRVVIDSVRNLAEVLDYASSGSAPFHVPGDVLVESFNRLQPRYYSISSSSSESPYSVSVTAVTLKYRPDPTPERTVFGVNTNYLWAVHKNLHDDDEAIQVETEYSVEGPNGDYFDAKNNTAKLPVHIRQSNFKLPSDDTKPVIMVGPGTGVAPFRGFVRERVYRKQHGKEIGPTILYFGCRRRDEDFLYKEEWPELFDILGENSKMINAFSRETEQKVYVQDKLKENGQETWNLIDNHSASIYVCGEAKRMAKDVQKAITGFAKQYGGLDDDAAEAYISKLRDSGRYQEDVWA